MNVSAESIREMSLNDLPLSFETAKALALPWETETTLLFAQATTTCSLTAAVSTPGLLFERAELTLGEVSSASAQR